MPALPTIGQDPWGSDLDAFLLAQHAADGSHNLGLDNLNDVTAPSPAAAQEIVRDGANTKWFNISHKIRVAAFEPAGDGVTDDTTALTNAHNAHRDAGRGYVEYTDKIYRAKNLPLYSYGTYDLNGA